MCLRGDLRYKQSVPKMYKLITFVEIGCWCRNNRLSVIQHKHLSIYSYIYFIQQVGVPYTPRVIAHPDDDTD